MIVRHPRTVAGLTKSGRLLLVVVDGRQPGWSVGMDKEEIASLLIRLGAVCAINLDGGGSSALWVRERGGLVNRPSDGRERPVSNHLGIRKIRPPVMRPR